MEEKKKKILQLNCSSCLSSLCGAALRAPNRAAQQTKEGNSMNSTNAARPFNSCLFSSFFSFEREEKKRKQKS